MMSFLEFECSEEQITSAIEYSSFENMKKIERGRGKNLLQHYKGNFGKSIGRVRKGKVNGYLEEFTKDDIEFVKEARQKYEHHF